MTPPAPSLHRHDALRKEIGWICQFVRHAALAYALWVLFSITTLWLDAGQVMKHYGGWLRADLSGVTSWQRLGGFAVHFSIWLLVAACVHAAWRLFSGFLEGRIFTLDAAIWLRRTALFGLSAQIGDILTRPLVTGLMTLHLPKGGRHLAIGFNQMDLVLLMFLAAFVALAHIFKSAAALAEENEGII